jgi:hypothetical protein
MQFSKIARLVFSAPGCARFVGLLSHVAAYAPSHFSSLALPETKNPV